MDPTVRGHQPAGPKRWARAAQWAAEHPHTAQAAKYKARLFAAKTVATNQGEIAWEHYRRNTLRGAAALKGPVYEYQTCSTRCAMLQLQLDLGCAGLEELHARVLAKPDRFLVPRQKNSPRRGKCKVCGGTVT